VPLPPGPLVERRPPYPGAPVEFSSLALTVNPTGRTREEENTVGLLRRALALGVTTFDTVDSADPSVAEALLARAFPEPDPRIVVLTSPPRSRDGGPAPPPLAPRARGDPRPGGGASAAPGFLRVYELDEGSDGPGRQRTPSVEGLAGARGPVAVRCRSTEAVLRAASRPPPRLLAGAYSVLDPRLLGAAEKGLGADGFSWIARDAFAGGRLDGSRFASGPASPRPGAPRSLRELADEFGPVSRLGFLALPRRRTLAQAALHFVTETPRVATTVIPLPSPERWAEIVGFRASPTLEPDERARIKGLAVPAVAAPRGDRRDR
jgi:aryl-alcohol dehydrogenase-like predicted oxidoreductase